MTLAVAFDQLLDYSDHERQKWRHWIAADVTRLDVPVQPGARFPTVGALLDHIFFVERRHLARLEGATPPESSGIPPGDLHRLFEYADLVRADLRRYARDIDDQIASEVLSFIALGGIPVSMSRRRLMMHVLLHEIRHFAQIALAARTSGIEPPGEHDLFYFQQFA